MTRDCFRPRAQCDRALKILCLIFFVWNLATISIEIIFARTPTGSIPVGDHAMNAIWRKKSVFDPLAQTVLVDRSPEVEIRVAVVITERCGSHAELSSWLEVFKNLAPVTLIASDATMTFIYDDEIEKVRRILFIQARPTLVFCKRLI